MEIKKQYLQKYIHEIAIAQIADEHLEKGYSILKNERIGHHRPDLIIKKGDEIIVIEVKSGIMTPEKKEKIKSIGNYIQTKGKYKFLVIVATPPREKELEVENIENLLSAYIIDNFPNELDELSTHTRMNTISDVEIDGIVINENSIFVKGNGVINIKLQYGSDSDQDNDNGLEKSDNLLFEFEITLEYNNKNNLEIVEVSKLEFDTSSFY